MEITLNGIVVRYSNDTLYEFRCKHCVKKYQCINRKYDNQRACFMLRTIHNLDYMVIYNLSEIASHHFLRGKVCDKEFFDAHY